MTGHTRVAARAAGRAGRRAAAELAAMTLLILSYIWLWQDSFPGDFTLCVALFVAIGAAAHLRSGETASAIGFGFGNLRPALLQAACFVGPVILAPLLVGIWLGSIGAAGAPRHGWVCGLLWRVLWGTAQQYGLLAFYYRRWRELLPGAAAPTIAAAGLFALFHLPNPFLTGVTLAAGLLSCWLYRRVPNLWALGLAHGLLSLSISRSLPLDVTFGLRVGPGFWRFLEALR